MGKGGDAAAAKRGPMKLVGEKSEKITWGEVKKHVSLVGGRSTLQIADGTYFSSLNFSLPLPIEYRSHPMMLGWYTKTRCTTYPTGTSTPEVELSSPMLVMI